MSSTQHVNRFLIVSLVSYALLTSSSCSLIVPESKDGCRGGACCDLETGKVRPSTFKCAEEPFATDQTCQNITCGGTLLKRFQYQYCDGETVECGQENLKWEETEEPCSIDGFCESAGQEPACGTCEAVCVAKSNGDGTCYDDETEHNNTPDQATPVDFDSDVQNIKLDSELDSIDYYSFTLDYRSGATLGWVVTATVKVDKVSGGAGHQLVLFFADENGATIVKEQCNADDNTCSISYLLATKPSDSASFLLGVRAVSARMKLDYALTLTKTQYGTNDSCAAYLDDLEPETMDGGGLMIPSLSLDTPYAASLCSQSDTIDHYGLEVTEVSKITLTIGVAASTHPAASLIVSLYHWDPGNEPNLYHELPFAAVHTGEELNLTRTFEPGNYLLTFRKHEIDSYFIAYTASLSTSAKLCTEADEPEENKNDFQSLEDRLPKLGTLAPVTDQTFCANDPDWWRVGPISPTIVAVLTATLTIDDDYSGYSSIAILGPNGELCAKQVFGTDNPAVANCNPTQEGTYYIGVVALEDNLTYSLGLDITSKN